LLFYIRSFKQIGYWGRNLKNITVGSFKHTVEETSLSSLINKQGTFTSNFYKQATSTSLREKQQAMCNADYLLSGVTRNGESRLQDNAAATN
jgi:hypothetical protein